ncbi:MAG: hypothetical protein JWN61_3170 [Pseudonocardiales bacterium]|nr:hypothetical protein [Pseudonocardiales bacterium]
MTVRALREGVRGIVSGLAFQASQPRRTVRKSGRYIQMHLGDVPYLLRWEGRRQVVVRQSDDVEVARQDGRLRFVLAPIANDAEASLLVVMVITGFNNAIESKVWECFP